MSHPSFHGLLPLNIDQRVQSFTFFSTLVQQCALLSLLVRKTIYDSNPDTQSQRCFIEFKAQPSENKTPDSPTCSGLKLETFVTPLASNITHSTPTTFGLYISHIIPKFRNLHSLTLNYNSNTEHFCLQVNLSNLTTKGQEG